MPHLSLEAKQLAHGGRVSPRGSLANFKGKSANVYHQKVAGKPKPSKPAKKR